VIAFRRNRIEGNRAAALLRTRRTAIIGSLADDDRQHAKTVVPKGQGDKGNEKR
jgi:hypothetical protein